MRRVRFENINVLGAGLPFTSGIVGNPDHPISDVTLANVHISASGGGTPEDAARVPPERIDSSLEPNWMKTLPAFGLYVRHARDIAVRDCSFVVERADARPAIVLDDVSGADLADIRSSAATDGDVREQASRAVRIGEMS